MWRKRYILHLHYIRRKHKRFRKPLIGSDAIKVPAQTLTFNGDSKQVSTYIGENVSIQWQGLNGSVTGDIKYVDKNDLFGDGENAGNYFPFKIDDAYTDKPITVRRTSSGNGTKTAKDTEWILRLSDNTETKFTVSQGDTILANLDFTGATLAEGE